MCPATRGVRCDLPTTVDALLNYHVQGNTSLASPALWDMMGSCKTKVALGTFAGEGGRECAASSWESWSCLFRFQPPAFSLCTSPPLPPPLPCPHPTCPHVPRRRSSPLRPRQRGPVRLLSHHLLGSGVGRQLEST